MQRPSRTALALSPDGGHPVYAASETRRAVVDVAEGEPISFGEPRDLFDREFFRTGPIDSWDIASDGRFVMVSASRTPPNP